MKTNHKNKKSYSRVIAYFILVLALSLSMGCKKFIEIPPPTTQVLTAAVFNSNTTATSAMLNIYRLMYSNRESLQLEIQAGLLSDEFVTYNFSTLYNNQYTNSMPVLTTYYGPWTNAYNYIYQANVIIGGLQNNNAITQSVAKQLNGEAKFIRAFWHLFLVNCFGDVPLVTTTDYAVSGKLARTPKAQVLSQVITDLTDAQGLLNTNFVDASDTTTTTDRVRPTKWAATALLARAYLFQGDYVNAEAQATSVINYSTQFSLLSDLTQVFKMNSKEAIWQLPIPLPNSNNTPDGAGFILTGTPQIQSLSPLLMNAFETGDQRKSQWTNAYTTTTGTITSYYYPFKYRVGAANATAISEYQMVLRLAEQYLIRAEARAQQNNVGGAQADLNAIRSRATLGTTTANDKPSLLAAILHERQVELFTEWGDRWFSMQRMGFINSIMGSPGNVCQYKGGTWSSDGHQALMPISITEIQNNPNLTQTPGY